MVFPVFTVTGDAYATQTKAVLNLSGVDISHLEPIKGLTSLKELWLKGTQVSDVQVAALQRALPKLRIVR